MSLCFKNFRFDFVCIIELVIKFEEFVCEKFFFIKNKCVEVLRFFGSFCFLEYLKVGIYFLFFKSLYRDKIKRCFMKN